MVITPYNWKNKNGTSGRFCNCGTWKQHWVNNSGKGWPLFCSVANCNNSATLGAHIINSNVEGEKIVPTCDSCNKLVKEFDLKIGITVVAANKADTCQK